MQSRILLDLRLPRILLGLLVGAALAVAGTTFQGLLRNPLADPYLLGVSGGAALGAVFVLTTGAAAGVPLIVPAAACGGALAAVAAVWRLASGAGALPPTALILSGVVVSAFCSALVMFLTAVAPAGRVQGALFWMMGSLASPPPGILPAVAVAVAARGRPSRSSRGRSSTPSRSGRRRPRTSASTPAGCGCGCSSPPRSSPARRSPPRGSSASSGLVVPHALRALVGADHRLLAPGLGAGRRDGPGAGRHRGAQHPAARRDPGRAWSRRCSARRSFSCCCAGAAGGWDERAGRARSELLLRRARGGERGLARGARGRDARHRRPERLGQDDAAAAALGGAAPERRRGQRSRPPGDRLPPARAGAAGGRGAAGRRHGLPLHGRGDGRDGPDAAPDLVGVALGARPRRSAARRCGAPTPSASPAARSTSSRAGSASGCSSPGRWRRRRGSSCWTRPRAFSIWRRSWGSSARSIACAGSRG